MKMEGREVCVYMSAKKLNLHLLKGKLEILSETKNLVCHLE